MEKNCLFNTNCLLVLYCKCPLWYLTSSRSCRSVSSSNCIAYGSADLLPHAASSSTLSTILRLARAPTVRWLWIYPVRRVTVTLHIHQRTDAHRACSSAVNTSSPHRRGEMSGPGVFDHIVRWQARAWWLQTVSVEQKVTGLIGSAGDESWLGVLEWHADPLTRTQQILGAQQHLCDWMSENYICLHGSLKRFWIFWVCTFPWSVCFDNYIPYLYKTQAL